METSTPNGGAQLTPEQRINFRGTHLILPPHKLPTGRAARTRPLRAASPRGGLGGTRGHPPATPTPLPATPRSRAGPKEAEQAMRGAGPGA